MSNETKDFYGKNVAEAIKGACEKLGVAQENLNIEVLETGSNGIFGLIRQKAHIRVGVQEIGEGPEEPRPKQQAERKKPRAKKKPAKPSNTQQGTGDSDKNDNANPVKIPERPQPETNDSINNQPANGDTKKEPVALSEESLTIIREELQEILSLMGSPSNVTVTDEDGTAHCQISAEHQEILTSQEGRVLDSLQYLLRKIISKKVESRVQLTIDVGDYREKRYRELRELAVEYAALVKKDGKTQVIPSLNPSERRIVHVELQDDPDIRSRSVGDGLFKKVLIFKPGKGRKSNNRNRGRSNYRKKNNSGQNQDS